MGKIRKRVRRHIQTILGKKISAFFAFAILTAIFVATTYFYLKVKTITDFRDLLIDVKYGGTLSEDLGFLALLTTEVSAAHDFNSNEEVEQTLIFRETILSLRARMEDIGRTAGQTGQELSPLPVNWRLDTLRSAEIINVLEKTSNGEYNIGGYEVADLSLAIGVEEGLERRPFLQSDFSTESEFFTFIPANLVQGHYGSIGVPENALRELFFSATIEEDLVETARSMPNITQVYFIPLSGFLNIRSLDNSREENIERYHDKFPPVKCFSDRNYFRKVMKASGEDHFHVTDPYIDVAGAGLVRTYSAFMHNRNLNIVGMIGFDRRIDLQEPFWGNVRLGAGIFKEFDLFFSEIVFGTYVIQPPNESAIDSSIDDELSRVFSRVNEEKDNALSGIRRWPLDKDSVVFTFPLGSHDPNEIGYFVLDPAKTAWRNRVWLIVYTLSISCTFVMLALLLMFRRSSLESEEFQAKIVSNINGAFLIVDKGDVIRQCNRRFKSIVKVSDSVGRDLKEFLSFEGMTEYRQLLREDESKRNGDNEIVGGFEFPEDLKTSEGARIPAIISCAPINYQGSPCMMIIAIPSRELELTIASRFLHTFSHALKTPVHSILLITDRLRRRKARVKIDHYFSLIQRQANEFSVMVNNVLEFSQTEIETKQLNKKSVNVAQILRSALSPVRDRALAAGIELIPSIPERLRAKVDENRFRMIFNNIIDNSLKYSEKGSKISIQASDLGTEIRITFSDTGIGVDDKDREHIFERFYRGSSQRVRQQEGLGLGLYLSRESVVAHGGELAYEPVSGSSVGAASDGLCGSRFTISIPKEES